MAPSSNPAFPNSPAFNGKGDVAAPVNAPSPEELAALYASPSAPPDEGGRMASVHRPAKPVDVFAVAVAPGPAGWFFPPLAFVGMIGGLILGFVNAFKRQP